MIEWRDTYEPAAYEAREDYAPMSQARMAEVTGHLDWFYTNYAAGAAEGHFTYASGRSEQLYRYGDVTVNAYGDPVVVDTGVSIAYTHYQEGIYRGVYEVDIARTFAVESLASYQLDKNLYVSNEKQLLQNAPLLERYVIYEMPGGERGAVCELRDLTTDTGEMVERPMCEYDCRQLMGEISKLYELYIAYRKERDTIER